jgi:hypothetical protein
MTDDHTTLTREWLNTEAWHKGYVAGRRGLMNDCNPFPVVSWRPLGISDGVPAE